MITIPFFALLFVYFFFILGFLIFSLVNIGHLVNTGTLTPISLLVTFLYVAFSISVIIITWSNVGAIDWQQPLMIWSTAWLTPVHTIGSAF